MPDEQYGKNQLTNPSFETGNLNGWTAVGTGMTVASGGTDGVYCASINGYISQQISFSFTPVDLSIQGDFLPEEDYAQTISSNAIPGEIIIELNYGDGTKDEVHLPFRIDGQLGESLEWV